MMVAIFIGLSDTLSSGNDSNVFPGAGTISAAGTKAGAAFVVSAGIVVSAVLVVSAVFAVVAVVVVFELPVQPVTIASESITTMRIAKLFFNMFFPSCFVFFTYIFLLSIPKRFDILIILY